MMDQQGALPERHHKWQEGWTEEEGIELPGVLGAWSLTLIFVRDERKLLR